jgi:hypothetical protein
MLNVFALQDMDWYLWLSIFLLLNQYTLALWALAIVHGAGMLGMMSARFWEMRKLDEALAPFRKKSGSE